MQECRKEKNSTDSVAIECLYMWVCVRGQCILGNFLGGQELKGDNNEFFSFSFPEF